MVLESNLEIPKVNKIPNKITKITAKVDTMEAPNPCIVPAIKIVLIAIKKGNLPVTRNKIIGKNRN